MDVRTETGIAIKQTPSGERFHIGRASRVVETRDRVYAMHVFTDGKVWKSINHHFVNDFPKTPSTKLVMESFDYDAMMHEAEDALARYQAVPTIPLEQADNRPIGQRK